LPSELSRAGFLRGAALAAGGVASALIASGAVESAASPAPAFFQALGRAGFRAETIFLAAQGDWVVDLHRGWSTSPAGLDMTWALAFRIGDSKIVEAINFATDQHAADAFFWRQYPLAALPTRLSSS
jgi:hypothetical protein